MSAHKGAQPRQANPGQAKPSEARRAAPRIYAKTKVNAKARSQAAATEELTAAALGVGVAKLITHCKRVGWQVLAVNFATIKYLYARVCVCVYVLKSRAFVG